MKTKIFVLAALLMASMVNVMADDDVPIAVIYTSDGQELSEIQGVNDFFISKGNEFIAGLQVGNRIKIDGFDIKVGDTIHAYIGDLDPAVHFPGSDYRASTSLAVSFYLTEDLMASIKEKDFRLHGHGAKINNITLYRGKHDVPGAIKFGKTIWTGYLWIDEWSTLEMFKEAFNGIDLSKYRAIRFYHEAGRKSIHINVYKDDWTVGNKIADENTMTMTDTYAELPLTNAVIEKIGEITSQMNIQCDKNGGSAFNFTDVVLLPISPDECSNCFYVY